MPKDIEIIGIFGMNNELGEGKTLLLTSGAITEHKNYPDRKIYTDYGLPFSLSINHVAEIPNISNSSIYLDDVNNFFDCRDSGKGNLNETWFLFQLRKLQNNFYYTSPTESSIEGRLRKISNLVYLTEQMKFPIFHIQKCDKKGNLLDEFYREYSKEVLEVYDTLEIVKRRVSLNLLLQLFNSYKSKVAFRTITKAKFSFKNNISDTVFNCIKADDTESIKQVLIPYGFELVS